MILIWSLSLAGCAGIPISSSGTNDSRSQKTAGNTQSKTGINELSGQAVESVVNRVPMPGTEFTVTDSKSGKQIQVIFGESYMAASGRRCAYFFENISVANTRRRPAGVACHQDDGGWIRASSRIPVSSGP